MASTKSFYPIIAQAETLLIYGIFLFLTGLAQIGVTFGYQYVIERSKHNDEQFDLVMLIPQSFTINEIHLWYIYPSAALVRKILIFNFIFDVLIRFTSFEYQSEGVTETFSISLNNFQCQLSSYFVVDFSPVFLLHHLCDMQTTCYGRYSFELIEINEFN